MATLAMTSAAPEPDDVDSWWARRADQAMATLLRLELHRLQGTNITSQTGTALRLRPSRVQPVTQVSPDGRYFPSDPAAFNAEVIAQARELYGGRTGLKMDSHRLLSGSARGRHRSSDTPDFRSAMHRHLSPSAPDQLVGGPPTIQELSRLLHRHHPR